jgi:DNA-binding response OmpR family regulator
LEQGGYRFDGWQLNRRLLKLTNAVGNPVVLTKGEYELLIAFLEAPQRPLTREYLAQATMYTVTFRPQHRRASHATAP